MYFVVAAGKSRRNCSTPTSEDTKIQFPPEMCLEKARIITGGVVIAIGPLAHILVISQILHAQTVEISLTTRLLLYFDPIKIPKEVLAVLKSAGQTTPNTSESHYF